jgi:hypothetical protein
LCDGLYFLCCKSTFLYHNWNFYAIRVLLLMRTSALMSVLRRRQTSTSAWRGRQTGGELGGEVRSGHVWSEVTLPHVGASCACRRCLWAAPTPAIFKDACWRPPAGWQTSAARHGTGL